MLLHSNRRLLQKLKHACTRLERNAPHGLSPVERLDSLYDRIMAYHDSVPEAERIAAFNELTRNPETPAEILWRWRDLSGGVTVRRRCGNCKLEFPVPGWKRLPPPCPLCHADGSTYFINSDGLPMGDTSEEDRDDKKQNARTWERLLRAERKRREKRRLVLVAPNHFPAGACRQLGQRAEVDARAQKMH